MCNAVLEVVFWKQLGVEAVSHPPSVLKVVAMYELFAKEFHPTMCGVPCITTTTTTATAALTSQSKLSGHLLLLLTVTTLTVAMQHWSVCRMLPLLLVLPMLLVPLPLSLTRPRVMPAPPTARRNLK